MSDDMDRHFEIVQTHPAASGFCPICGQYAKGFSTCPWCCGVRKKAKREKLYVGRVEVR